MHKALLASVNLQSIDVYVTSVGPITGCTDEQVQQVSDA